MTPGSINESGIDCEGYSLNLNKLMEGMEID